MSHRLISRSPDLKRLRDEGYNTAVQSGYLVVRDVPYVNENAEVKHGVLICQLTLAGDVTTQPGTHQMYLMGDYPCHANGAPIEQIRHTSPHQPLVADLIGNHFFSAKPPCGFYSNYYEQVTTYANILGGPAQYLVPGITAKTFPTIVDEEDDSVFNYFDSASSRANIVMATQKLALSAVALVGVGGTGSYVLDLLAKTPIKELHLFDGDVFSQHNAFRAPGAPDVTEFNKGRKKVDYLCEIYSKMRRGIIPHPDMINASNVEQLRGMNFVFLCMDAGNAKRLIVESLEAFGVPFVDVGMGVNLNGDTLDGIVRTTTSTNERRDHLRRRVSLADLPHNGDYNQNIQIADLNALNAALAVIRWKKWCGFYGNSKGEYHSTYTISTNSLLSEERA